MVGLLILFIVLILVAWILIAPLELHINSTKNQYQLRWGRVARIEWLPAPDDILIRLKILFREKVYHPLTRAPKKKIKTEDKSKSTKQKKGWSLKKWKRKIINLLNSFQVEKFRVNLDTGDYVYNSYLYPIFWMMNKGDTQLNINYSGESEILVVIKNRLYRILKALLF